MTWKLTNFRFGSMTQRKARYWKGRRQAPPGRFFHGAHTNSLSARDFFKGRRHAKRYGK